MPGADDSLPGHDKDERSSHVHDGDDGDRNWDRYHVAERAKLRGLVLALGEHRELQADLSLACVTLSRAEEFASAKYSAHPDHGAYIARDHMDREHDCVIAWLTARYCVMMLAVYLELDLPPDFLINTLDMALGYGWDVAVRWLDAAVAVFYAEAEPRVSYGVFPDATDSRGPKGLWVEREQQVQCDAAGGIWFSRPPVGTDVEDYIAVVTRIIRTEWKNLASWRRAYPGKRKGGRPTGRSTGGSCEEGYLPLVRLYNLWRENPTRYGKRTDLWRGREPITWAQFLDVVNGSKQFSTDYVSEHTLRRATQKAIDWVAPVDGVPSDPAAFEASNPRLDSWSYLPECWQSRVNVAEVTSVPYD
jgi:hypothetical protein